MDSKKFENIWSFILGKWNREIPSILLVVLDSKGSSPGRQGFKMVVSQDGSLFGSIGGGIMEHKLVEKARDMLRTGTVSFFYKKQIHRKDIGQNRSGLICSGEQFVVLCPINKNNITLIEKITSLGLQAEGSLSVSPQQIDFTPEKISKDYEFIYKSNEDWKYKEKILTKNVIHIIGGGHVGLALSSLMRYLDFHVKIYDDREGLSTMLSNTEAHEKIFTPYDKIDECIAENDQHFIVIMTFGYRGDKVVLKKLLGKKFKYMGMMGSEAKIKQLFRELDQEGIPSEQLDELYAPIGMPIYSKTTKEIAVSVAAEIIKIKNKDLPTGRSY